MTHIYIELLRQTLSYTLSFVNQCIGVEIAKDIYWSNIIVCALPIVNCPICTLDRLIISC